MSEEEFNKVVDKIGLELSYETKIELRTKDEKNKKEAFNLLKSLGNPEVLTFEKLEEMFGNNFYSPYSREFGMYIMENRKEFFSNPDYVYNFQQMHDSFRELISKPDMKPVYERGDLKLDVLYNYSKNIIKFDYEQGEKEAAELASKHLGTQEQWEEARRLFKVMQKREGSTIPPVQHLEKKYRGRMLRVDDPLGIFVGNITKCCQKIEGAGHMAMEHGVTEKNGGIFVIEELDENGKVINIVAQSWVWRNDDVMCFDNIEVDGDSFTKEEQEEVLEIYREVGEKAIAKDEKALSELLKQNKISKEQYEYYTLKEVRIGLDYGEGMPLLLNKALNGELEKSYDVVRPKERENESGMYDGIDSENSVIIAKSSHKRINRVPGVMKEVIYKKPREITRMQGKEVNNDVISNIKEIEREVYREEQHSMQDCYTIYDLAEILGSDLEEIKVTISRDKDWYAVYYDEGNSTYIADVALKNGANSRRNIESKTNVISSTLELQYEMLNVFLESAKNGRTITCDATKDTSGLNIDKLVEKGLVKIISDKEYSWEESGNIEMRKMELRPDVDKIEKEIKQLRQLLDKAYERNSARVKEEGR